MTTATGRTAHHNGEHVPTDETTNSTRALWAAACVYCARLYTAAGEFKFEARFAAHEVEDSAPVAAKSAKASGGSKASTRVQTPASAKQVAFIVRLLAERDIAGTKYAGWNEEIAAAVSSVKASDAIGDLLNRDRKTVSAPTILWSAPKPVVAAESLSEGMYRRAADGEVFKVQKSKTSGNLYAKQLTIYTDENGTKSGSFEYAAGAIRTLKASDRMTLDQAKAFGHEHVVCCACGRTLTNPESIAAGIGPICGGRL